MFAVESSFAWVATLTGGLVKSLCSIVGFVAVLLTIGPKNSEAEDETGESYCRGLRVWLQVFADKNADIRGNRNKLLAVVVGKRKLNFEHMGDLEDCSTLVNSGSLEQDNKMSLLGFFVVDS